MGFAAWIFLCVGIGIICFEAGLSIAATIGILIVLAVVLSVLGVFRI